MDVDEFAEKRGEGEKSYNIEVEHLNLVLLRARFSLLLKLRSEHLSILLRKRVVTSAIGDRTAVPRTRVLSSNGGHFADLCPFQVFPVLRRHGDGHHGRDRDEELKTLGLQELSQGRRF